jgi:hypothetical protein
MRFVRLEIPSSLNLRFLQQLLFKPHNRKQGEIMTYYHTYVTGIKHVLLWATLINSKEKRINGVRCNPHIYHFRMLVPYWW